MNTQSLSKSEKIIAASVEIYAKRQEADKVNGELNSMLEKFKKLTKTSGVRVSASEVKPAPEASEKRPGSQRIILKALKAATEPVAIGAIIEKSKLSSNAIQVAMKKLLEEGVVKKVKFGTYELKK